MNDSWRRRCLYIYNKLEEPEWISNRWFGDERIGCGGGRRSKSPAKRSLIRFVQLNKQVELQNIINENAIQQFMSSTIIYIVSCHKLLIIGRHRQTWNRGSTAVFSKTLRASCFATCAQHRHYTDYVVSSKVVMRILIYLLFSTKWRRTVS